MRNSTAKNQPAVHQLTKDDIPRYTNGNTATVELPSGWSAAIRIEYDDSLGAPWKEHDGHGVIEDVWQNVNGRVSRRRSADGSDKRPSERAMRDYHREIHAYYDFAATMEIAKRDGWGCGNDEHAHKTAGEIAACAVEQDFARMEGWLRGPDAGGWGWIGVIVTLKDAEGDEVESESLWGIEDDTDYWREVAAELINGLAAGRVLPNE